MSQFGRVDEAVPILVEHFEPLNKVLHTSLFSLTVDRQVYGEKFLKTHSLAAWKEQQTLKRQIHYVYKKSHTTWLYAICCVRDCNNGIVVDKEVAIL